MLVIKGSEYLSDEGGNIVVLKISRQYSRTKLVGFFDEN